MISCEYIKSKKACRKSDISGEFFCVVGRKCSISEIVRLPLQCL